MKRHALDLSVLKEILDAGGEIVDQPRFGLSRLYYKRKVVAFGPIDGDWREWQLVLPHHLGYKIYRGFEARRDKRVEDSWRS